MAENDFLTCAVCSITYGVRTGDQPPGTMSWSLESFSCDGYPNIKTWVINYNFNSGYRNGNYFHHDRRTALLPNTKEGNEVLALLIKAFRRKLIFTVGYSVVRSRDNCIVWNSIHHKTNSTGGATNYGYPDDTYFNRVKNELAYKGVLLESEEELKAVTES